VCLAQALGYMLSMWGLHPMPGGPLVVSVLVLRQ
jgi:hypothetical protein